MDLFGIGGPELLAVLVIALLVLGPERMVDFARQMGRWWREAQLAVRTMADAATTRLDEEQPKRNAPPREPVPEPEDTVARGDAGGATGSDDGGPSEQRNETPRAG